jgi:hypothetical protein
MKGKPEGLMRRPPGLSGRFRATIPMVLALLGMTVFGSGSPVTGQEADPPGGATRNSMLVDQYCLTCHNDRAMTGNLSLEGIDPDRPEAAAETWEKVTRKLRAGLMPPTGAPRPERGQLDAFRASIESAIDAAARAIPNPGVTLLHRMNRAEYGNAIRDLLGIEVDASALLPPDDSLDGLDNIADVLGTSPALVERYISAAARISRLAVGNTDISPLSTAYRVRGDLSQDQHVEGLPIGTRGGLRVEHNFPVDGEYVFRFSLLNVNFGPRYGGPARDQQLEMTVNGERVGLIDLRPVPFYYIGGGGRGRGGDAEAPLELTLPVRAGPQTIGVAFIQRTAAAVDDLVQRFDATTGDLQTGVQFGYTTVPHLSGLEIVGPYGIAGPGSTPGRERIFVCRPASPELEAECAREIIRAFGRRAFRRPVTDGEIEPLFSFYRAGREAGSFDSGIEMAVRRILADPEFVFRFERAPEQVSVGTPYRVSDLELASRLSFFLWSSIPDEELLTLAEQGALGDPSVLRQQVGRMLGDPRSAALVENFSGQWLFLRELANRNPDLLVFPDFDENLRGSFARETELLFETIVREDRSVFDVLDADYTFVNERLARHYGIPNIYGTDFRRVQVPGDARRGLFGQGSFLTLTSATNRTSPVTRGAWVLENLLGSPPPQPPPNVPALPENTEGQGIEIVPTSVRERMIRHRDNPACRNCHQLMDPIGLALENFDAIGRWRTMDSGSAVDASGLLVDGTAINGVEDLRSALLGYPDAFLETLTEKLLMYATGRAVHYYDMTVVRAIAAEAAGNDYRFSSLVQGIVASEPFQMRMKTAEDTP